MTDDERLCARLRAYHHTGRPPEPMAAMWRAGITKYALGLRYNVELVRLLRANPQIRRLCGFGDAVPNASVICRFFQRLTCHSDLVERAIQGLAARLADAVAAQQGAADPPVGQVVAIAATDLEAGVDTARKPYRDPAASGGIRANGKVKGGQEQFYGYKMHSVCDAHYGIPLGHIILPANANDSPQRPGVFRQVRAAHPGLWMRYALADRGYDALSNYRYRDEPGILPIIRMQNTDPDGIYTTDGRPKCLGRKPMDYISTDRRPGHLFRCRPQGCQLTNRSSRSRCCVAEHYENPTGDGDLRRFEPPSVLRNGPLRVVGYATDDRFGIIELTGPGAELSQVYIIVDRSAYDAKTRTRHAITPARFAAAAAPTWDNAAHWIADNAITVMERGEAAATYRGRQITLHWDDATRWLSLKVQSSRSRRV